MSFDVNYGYYGMQTPMGGQIYAVPVVPFCIPYQQANTQISQKLFDNRERFSFQKPTENMNWQLAGSIDPNKVMKKGDITTVKFCIQEFKDSRVDKNDKEHFPSDESYNAFRIMQLGLHYLSTENEKICEQFDSIAAMSNESAMSQARDKIEENEKLVEEKDATIDELKQRIEELEKERENDQKQIKQLKEKLHHTRQINIQLRERLSDTEEGLAHTETARKRFNSIRKRIKN